MRRLEARIGTRAWRRANSHRSASLRAFATAEFCSRITAIPFGIGTSGSGGWEYVLARCSYERERVDAFGYEAHSTPRMRRFVSRSLAPAEKSSNATVVASIKWRRMN